MKYLKTVDLWDTYTQLKLETGELKLQSGQWVQCGNGPKSRFHSVRQTGSIYAFHGGSEKEATEKYLSYVAASKESRR